MKSPFGLIRNLGPVVYRPSVNYCSQNAEPKSKTRKRAPKRLIGQAEKAFTGFRRSIDGVKMNFLYLSHATVAEKFAKLVMADQGENPVAHMIEINPGIGLLTQELLRSGIPLISIYEDYQHFWPYLEELKNEYQDRVNLHKISLAQVINLGYWDWRQKTEEMETHITNVEKRSWKDEPAFHIIGSIDSEIFLRFIIGSYVFKNGLSKYGRACMYLAVPPSLSERLTANNDHYHLYRSWVVMFQTLFELTKIGELPRNGFHPKYRKRLACNSCIEMISRSDKNIMHVLRIEARKDVFSDEFTQTDIIGFNYFLHNNLRARTTRIIPQLEQWVPGCGRKLIAEGYTIFTQFGQLTPRELLKLFILFKSLPNYSTSNFLPSMTSYFLKMEQHYGMDDITDTVDEIFDPKITEHSVEQDTKDR